MANLACMSSSWVSEVRLTSRMTAPVRRATSCQGVRALWCSATDSTICSSSAARVNP